MKRILLKQEELYTMTRLFIDVMAKKERVDWKHRLIRLFEKRKCVMSREEIFLSLYPFAPATKKKVLKRKLTYILSRYKTNGFLHAYKNPGYTSLYGLHEMFKGDRVREKYISMAHARDVPQINLFKDK